MALLLRQRSSLLRLATVAGRVSHAATSRAEQQRINDEAQVAFEATQGPPARLADEVAAGKPTAEALGI